MMDRYFLDEGGVAIKTANGWRIVDATERFTAPDGSTYTWELRNLPWIEPEEYSPSLASLTPRLMVSYFLLRRIAPVCRD